MPIRQDVRQWYVPIIRCLRMKKDIVRQASDAKSLTNLRAAAHVNARRKLHVQAILAVGRYVQHLLWPVRDIRIRIYKMPQ